MEAALSEDEMIFSFSLLTIFIYCLFQLVRWNGLLITLQTLHLFDKGTVVQGSARNQFKPNRSHSLELFRLLETPLRLRRKIQRHLGTAESYRE